MVDRVVVPLLHTVTLPGADAVTADNTVTSITFEYAGASKEDVVDAFLRNHVVVESEPIFAADNVLVVIPIELKPLDAEVVLFSHK